MIKKLKEGLKNLLPGSKTPKVAVLSLKGVIGGGGRTRQSLSDASVADQIEKAFSMSGLSAVALKINSPGGSPVQSALIADRIRRLAKEKDVPVLAFAEDVAASGGYMLALAADKIYAHEASIVGSIGVVSGGFGFKGLIEKLGVERRIHTAGTKKAMLDPFVEEKDEDVARLKEIQAEIHDYFIGFVKGRRGRRLKGEPDVIFSGDVFLGAEAVKLGLIDGLGDAKTVLKKRFGDKVKTRDFTEKKSLISALFGLRRGGMIGLSSPDAWIDAVEERSIWSRFGL